MEAKNFKGHAVLIAVYIIFGISTPIAKTILIHGDIAPIALVFYRMAGATVLFWGTSLFTKKEAVSFRDLSKFFLASMLGISINQHSFVHGLSLTSPIDAAVITTLAPVLTLILSTFFLKEPVTWKKAAGVLIGTMGAVLLILNSTGTDREGLSIGGNLLCLLSTLSFAVYLTAFKKIIMKYSAITLMKWMFLFATICCLPLCWKDVTSIDYTLLPVDIYLKITYIVVLSTFVSYLLIPTAQKLVRPIVVSMYNYIRPVVSSLIAVALGLDVFGWTKGIATLLVFLGVYIVTKSKSYTPMEARKE
jgi:drug/metabolite transporter (DMT)-like permease